MPIYVAKTYDEKVESIVLADSYELAQAYWQGKEIYTHQVLTFTEKDLDNHPTGVLPLLSTEKIKASRFGSNEEEYLIVS